MDSASTYDINWPHPLPESGLETARVKLTPFIPHIHGPKFFAQLSTHPDIERFIPGYFTPELIDGLCADPESVLFAVINKERSVVAGMIGLLHTSSSNLSTEIGPVICFPEFQRTFVNTNAIGILLRYCLNRPEEGGLGFRRVQWTANPANAASVKTAERMGLKLEGIMRWTWVLPKGKEGKEAGAGRGEGVGRDTVMLGVCWDDWENGVREHVAKQIDRA
ncbi:N-acetyltransferase domain-containing protein [Mycena sanguinolenta]|uniref:N-acetyltransferase domain-containing protein n=1 Tax=Mycena sanguinolenta TaxID=230812 RepID=A0A8H6ZDJ6_9AGAR|nr:N-acetyltransferase domain-containing protein [Mycena sanguinolenta]